MVYIKHYEWISLVRCCKQNDFKKKMLFENKQENILVCCLVKYFIE